MRDAAMALTGQEGGQGRQSGREKETFLAMRARINIMTYISESRRFEIPTRSGFIIPPIF